MSVTIPRIADEPATTHPSPSNSTGNLAAGAATKSATASVTPLNTVPWDGWSPSEPGPKSAEPAAGVAVAARPKREVPSKPRLTPAQQFRLWIGRPLLAGIAFATLVAVGVPAAAATYTRDSPNPVAWRNLSLYEVQGKLQYCLKGMAPATVLNCDYARVAEVGGLEPRKGRIHRTVILKSYPVPGPVIVDPAPPADTGAAAAPSGTAGYNQRPGPVPVPATYPVIRFPAGPMSAIEATCEAAKTAAERQSAAYQQNVERQCEAAKQAYERSHPGG